MSIDCAGFDCEESCGMCELRLGAKGHPGNILISVTYEEISEFVGRLTFSGE